MDRHSVSILGSIIGTVGAAFGLGGAAGPTGALGPSVMRPSRSNYSSGRMLRRSTLHAKKRSYQYDPFTPAPMAAYYNGEPTRQVARQHQRRLASAVESREKRTTRRAA